MTFERSPNGQENRAKFYGVDAIFYVEGGRNHSSDNEAFDILFWRKILSVFQPDMQVKFEARGGKDTLLSLAEGIIENDIQNTFVAMDRDYDEVFGTLVDDSRVFYTYGYSFENDVFSRQQLARIFYDLCPLCENTINVNSEIDTWWTHFEAKMRWPHVADCYAFSCGVKGLDRDRPQKYFVSNAYASIPAVSNDQLVSEVTRIAGACRDVRAGLGLPKPFRSTNFIGHIVQAFAFRIMTRLHSCYSKIKKLNIDGVVGAAISALQYRIVSDPEWEISTYYKTRFDLAFEHAEIH